MIDKDKIKIIIFLLTFFVFFQTGFSQKSSESLEKEISMCMKDESLGNIFRVLINEYDIAIGLEQSALDRDHTKYDFDTNIKYKFPDNITAEEAKKLLFVPPDGKEDFSPGDYKTSICVENATIKEVFDILVKQMKYYSWEGQDGVINIYPIKGRDKRYEKLLNMKIEKFILKKNTYIFSIRNDILKLPELDKFREENELFTSLTRGGRFTNKRRLSNEEKIYTNLTLKQLLNSITKYKQGGWILRKKGMLDTQREYFEIDI